METGPELDEVDVQRQRVDPCSGSIGEQDAQIGVGCHLGVPWDTSPKSASFWGRSPRSPSPSATPGRPASPGTYSGTDATQTSTTHSSQLTLAGRDDDILLPTIDQINSTSVYGQNMWTSYISDAGRYAPSSLPQCCLQPSLVLKDIPPLPTDIRGKRSLRGNAIWKVPCPELAVDNIGSSDDFASNHEDEPWCPDVVSGAQKTFYLWIKKPVDCGILPEPPNSRGRLTGPDGLAILAFCWSYIFSVRLLEMQHRRVYYSTVMSPILSVGSSTQDVLLPLGRSSQKLVRWLSAVLAPGPGWFVQGSIPPWTAHYNQDIRLVIGTERTTDDLLQEKPPSFAEAIDLILELCSLYDFGSQPTEAFLVVLLIPFHAAQDMQPRFSLPHLPPPTKISRGSLRYIRDYAEDIRYYMTLSLSARVISSAIWGIFWEPGIDSNVASVWLGSIYNVLQPVLEASNSDLLIKILAIRSPRLAPLWLGYLRCGSVQTFEMVRRYLTTHHEHLGWSLGYPDLDVAAWTGLRQSFLHEECSKTYKDPEGLVSTADVLRHRFNFRLADKDIYFFGWQPFGTMNMRQIEPELVPRLESTPPLREYKHWVWWLDPIKIKGCYIQNSVIENGFLRDKRVRCQVTNEATYVDLLTVVGDVAAPAGPTSLHPSSLDEKLSSRSFKQGPSKQATLHVLRMGSWEATGDRAFDSMGIPEIRKHEWLRGQREF